MAQAREQWHERMSQFQLQNLVFIDESGAKTNMTPLYGRNFDGARLVDASPAARWETTTMVGALRCDGVGACMALQGPLDGASFEQYVEQVLCPTLRPGDVVVLDNLSSHKSERARKAIEACDARMIWLPAYSPDFNPIEKMWSKIKQFLRRTKARAQDALFDAISAALDTVTPSDAQAWFRSCGYAS